MGEKVPLGTTRIGLALSGGGFRAAVFHLGIVRWLAEEHLLERVTQVSTVSGGSLVTGAIFSAAGGEWPSSSEFLQTVYSSPTFRRAQYGTSTAPVLRPEKTGASRATPWVTGSSGGTTLLTWPSRMPWRPRPLCRTSSAPSSSNCLRRGGGKNENMAIEPLYKPIEGLQGCDVLICGDASGPLGPPSGILSSLLKGRLASPRLFDIASDQIRALRSRMLMKAISQEEIAGFLSGSALLRGSLRCRLVT